MLPSKLTAADFRSYPEMARAFVVSNLQLLSTLPLALVGSILREAIGFDWLFPAEQSLIRSQLTTLQSLSGEQRTAAIAGFASISIPREISDLDWVNKPARFVEDLTAYLWSSSQIDAFRTAAIAYAKAVNPNEPERAPELPRACLVVLPKSLDKPGYPPFRKLRPHGVFFENITPSTHDDDILHWMRARAAGRPMRLTHFYVEGDRPVSKAEPELELVSWSESGVVRGNLLRRLHQMMQTPGVGPEMARTQMAGFSPADLGLNRTGAQSVMDHFLVKVLTEGSGTQIFSTTFVQWSARELLRRAEPATLLVRFGVRDQLRPMNAMLSSAASNAAPDPEGSFLDADMGAYYTWLNQQRLSGAASARFLAFSQARGQAVAIGPGLAQGTFARDPMSLAQVLKLLS